MTTPVASPPRRLVYVRDATAGPDVPGAEAAGADVLDAWHLHLPVLFERLDRCGHLVIADPLSFPYERIRDSDRDLPTTVVVPDDLDADTALRTLGGPLLRHLTVHDRVVCRSTVWPVLRDGGGLVDRQWIDAGDAAAAGTAGEGPPRSRAAKADLRRIVEPLRPLVADAAVRTPGGRPPRLWVDVGDGPDGIVHSFLGVADVVDARDDASERTAWADLGLAVDVLAPLAEDERRDRVRRAWRTVRPGGGLVVVERVVHPGGTPDPFDVAALLETLALATATMLTLRGVMSFSRYGETRRTSVLLRLDRLGNAEAG